MGVTLYYGYYPKECNHKNVIPYLDCEFCYDMNGKHLPEEFYSLCNEIGEWNQRGLCWVFSDRAKLYEFCADQSVPAEINDYVADPYDICDDYETVYKDDDIFIIWKR